MPCAHFRLGQSLFMQNQYQEGLRRVQSGKEGRKNLPDPDVATALMYDQLKIADKAQQLFDRAMPQRIRPIRPQSRPTPNG